MVPLTKYQNKKIAIYGMGITGFSAAKILKKSKAEVLCWDDKRKVREKVTRSNFKIKKFWEERKKIDKIVISPGIDIYKCKIKNFLKKNYKKIITDIDLFFEYNKGDKIISITGTNGKSTTCKIIEKILKSAKHNVKTLGNIGSPILFSSRRKKNYVFVLEISSYQLQYSKLFRSKHAAILNLSPDHLERHESMENYTKIKSRIFYAQKSSDFSYINANNKYSKKIKNIILNKKIKSKLVLINKSNYNYLIKKINNKYFNSEGNFENLIFAYKIVKSLGVSDKIIIKSINKFKGLPHRQEVIFSRDKLLFINDSKATSFDASLQSLSNYNNIYWIVGGLPKYKDYFNLNSLKKKIVKAYIIGKNTSFFEKQLKNKIPYTISKNMNVAIQNIIQDLKIDKHIKKTILFSPASASFDQFRNFEERGNYFKNLILKKFKKNND